MTAEDKVLRDNPSAFIERKGRVWRVYSERNVPELLGSGVTKIAAWEAAWKNIPAKDKRGYAQRRKLDRMRAKLAAEGWEEISAIMDVSWSFYTFQRDKEFVILTISGKADAIRRFVPEAANA